MVLPVKLSIDQSTHLAHTVDITAFGARLGGLHTELQPGTTVELQRGSRRAKFQVKWVQQVGSNETHIGVQSPEALEKFWGVDLHDRDRESKKDIDALMTLLTGGSKQAR
jgi:hypothetical protein